jgi:hypothetical protein
MWHNSQTFSKFFPDKFEAELVSHMDHHFTKNIYNY